MSNMTGGGRSVRRGGRRKRLGIWQPSCPMADRGECGVREPDPSGLRSEQSRDLSSGNNGLRAQPSPPRINRLLLKTQRVHRHPTQKTELFSGDLRPQIIPAKNFSNIIMNVLNITRRHARREDSKEGSAGATGLT